MEINFFFFFFTFQPKLNLFWLTLSVKETVPNNYAHFHFQFSSLPEQLYITYK